MKIIRVEGVLLSAELPEEHIVRWSGGEMAIANSALAVIHTDEGIIGVGDTYAGGWFYPEAAKAMVAHFDKLLVGRDPRDPIRLAREIWNKSLYWGRVGAGANAISAIENALWDIAGKAAGVPCWQLLGGKVHDRIKVYASAGLQKPDNAVRAEMQAHVQAGYRAVKIRVPTDLDAAVAKVALCREALGPDVELMVDAVMGSHPEPWDYKTAIRFADAIGEFDITWLEEPCAGDDYEGYARVRKATTVPVSGGETSFGLGEFRHFFNAGSLDIAQPDACTSGGIIECKRICAAAAMHGVRIAPHAWGSGATVMANVHWAFTEPNVFVQEIPTWGFPLRDALLIDPVRLDENGCIAPPTHPGLGIKLDDDIRAQFAYRPGGGATMRKG